MVLNSISEKIYQTIWAPNLTHLLNFLSFVVFEKLSCFRSFSLMSLSVRVSSVWWVFQSCPISKPLNILRIRMILNYFRTISLIYPRLSPNILNIPTLTKSLLIRTTECPEHRDHPLDLPRLRQLLLL